MRPLQDHSRGIEVPLGHAELVHAQQNGGAVEQTQHDRFSVQHWNHRDADVYLMVGDANLNTSVLGDSLFSNVQLAQDLEPRDDGGLELLDLGGHRCFLEHAVDAVTDAQRVLERLDMHVRSPQFDGLGEDLVDEADDGGSFSRLGQVHIVVGVRVDDLEAVLAGFRDHRLDRIGPDTQILLDTPVNIRQRS